MAAALADVPRATPGRLHHLVRHPEIVRVKPLAEGDGCVVVAHGDVVVRGVL